MLQLHIAIVSMNEYHCYKLGISKVMMFTNLQYIMEQLNIVWNFKDNSYTKKISNIIVANQTLHNSYRLSSNCLDMKMKWHISLQPLSNVFSVGTVVFIIPRESHHIKIWSQCVYTHGTKLIPPGNFQYYFICINLQFRALKYSINNVQREYFSMKWTLK